MNIIASLEKRSKPFWSVIGFVLIGGLGILDFLTGYEFSFSLFYLLPISLVVWFTGRRLGVAASTYSAIVWLIADIASGQSYSHPVIFFLEQRYKIWLLYHCDIAFGSIEKSAGTRKELVPH